MLFMYMADTMDSEDNEDESDSVEDDGIGTVVFCSLTVQ